MSDDTLVAQFAALPEAARAEAAATFAKYGVPVPELLKPAAPVAPETVTNPVSSADDLKVTAPDPLSKFNANSTRAELDRAFMAQGEAPALNPNDPTLFAPQSASDYKIRYSQDVLEGVNVEEATATDQALREAFHVAGVPSSYAQPLADALINTAGQFDGLSEEELKTAFAAEGVKLKRLQTPEQLKETIRLSELVQSRMPQEFRDFANLQYAFTSADAYTTLAAVGRMIEYAEEHSKKK